MHRLLVLFLFILITGCTGEPTPEEGGGFSKLEVLRDSYSRGYQKASRPINIQFPADHGPHPEFRNEWWYFTGNLRDGSGREFGYQFTIFRTAILPRITRSATTNWLTRNVYLGHFAISDIAEGDFYAKERFSRESLDLAGASAEPFKVWVENWSITSDKVAERFSIFINAKTDEISLDILLDADDGPVLHGDRGLFYKNRSKSRASYYYSMTDMPTRGDITVRGRNYKVEGASWFDHEWSTADLDSNFVGWDWFSIQLSDDTEIMLYKMRDDTDSHNDHYGGTVIYESGEKLNLTGDDFSIVELNTWRSEKTGRVYPSGWKLTIPDIGAKLTVIPKMRNQEVDLSFRYWEGAVSVNGELNATPVSGSGYVEATGY